MTWIQGIRNDKKKLDLWEHIALVEEYGGKGSMWTENIKFSLNQPNLSGY